MDTKMLTECRERLPHSGTNIYGFKVWKGDKLVIFELPYEQRNMIKVHCRENCYLVHSKYSIIDVINISDRKSVFRHYWQIINTEMAKSRVEGRDGSLCGIYLLFASEDIPR